jgi:hypothetical protein
MHTEDLKLLELTPKPKAKAPRELELLSVILAAGGELMLTREAHFPDGLQRHGLAILEPMQHGRVLVRLTEAGLAAAPPSAKHPYGARHTFMELRPLPKKKYKKRNGAA